MTPPLEILRSQCSRDRPTTTVRRAVPVAYRMDVATCPANGPHRNSSKSTASDVTRLMPPRHPAALPLNIDRATAVLRCLRWHTPRERVKRANASKASKAWRSSKLTNPSCHLVRWCRGCWDFPRVDSVRPFGNLQTRPTITTKLYAGPSKTLREH